MDSNKFKLVLAMTVITVPLAFTGCGKDVEEVPVEDTQASVESTINTEVNETIEEDLADEGIEVTPTQTPDTEKEESAIEDTENLDESFNGTWYVLGDQSLFEEASDTSIVVKTVPDTTAVTALGMVVDTEFIKVSLEDGTIGYMLGGNLDVAPGGVADAEELEDTEESAHMVEEEDLTEGLTEEEVADINEQIDEHIDEVLGTGDNGIIGGWTWEGCDQTPEENPEEPVSSSDIDWGDSSDSQIDGTIVIN